MKQVFVHLGHGAIEVLDVPAPTLSEGMVVVRTLYSAISPGTEKSIINIARKNIIQKAESRPDMVAKVFGKIRAEGLFSTISRVSNRLDSYVPLGYSAVGEVIDVAPDISHLSKGDIVCCMGAGFANHAEIITVPKNLCIKVPEGVASQDASLCALASIALQGIRRAGLTQGESVAVVGLGVIGQITLHLLTAYGHTVFGIDRVLERVNRAKDEGFLAARDATSSPQREFDAVIITASSTSSEVLEFAGVLARNKGRIVIVGDVHVEIPRKIYYEKELDVFFSRSYGPGRYDPTYEIAGMDYPFAYVRWTEQRNCEEFLRLLEHKKISLGRLISCVCPIEQAPGVYEKIQGDPSLLTSIFTYQNSYSSLSTNTIFFGDSEGQSQSSISVGIIGAGVFAREVILPTLKAYGMSLRALSIRNPSYVRQLQKKFHPHYITSDHKTILNDPKINFVIITTPHHLHAPFLLDALQAGKHVYLEKPLCIRESELYDIMLWCQKNKNHPYIFLGFNRRYSPSLTTAKHAFPLGAKLDIIYRVNNATLPREHWLHDPRIGGGRIVGQLCHMIDTISFLTGSKPISVFARSLASRGPYDSDIHAMVEYENGSLATIIDTIQGAPGAPKEYIEIHGAHRTFILQDFIKYELYEGNRKRKSSQFVQNKGHQEELKAYLACMQEGRENNLGLEDIFLTTLTTFKILDSLKNNRLERISLSEFFLGYIQEGSEHPSYLEI